MLSWADFPAKLACWWDALWPSSVSGGIRTKVSFQLACRSFSKLSSRCSCGAAPALPPMKKVFWDARAAAGRGSALPSWALVAAALALLDLEGCAGSSSQSLQYFDAAISGSGHGLPQFTEVGYVNRQLFARYDSNTRKMLPRVSWIKEVEKEDPLYWDLNTQNAQGTELTFRGNLKILMNRYNQTVGFHIVQKMYGCELLGDGSKEGYLQYGYNGKDYIAFDKKTLTWTAVDAQAQVTKRKWDANGAWNQHLKSYLEENCIAWLKKYLEYGNETLRRKELPQMKVTSKFGYDDMETLICRADGFYPKDIEVVWTRDGKVWEHETLHGLVTPNSDGTYHIWISIKINIKDRDRFRCRVDHASLEGPVDFAVEEPAPAFNLWPIVICLVFGVLLVAVIGIWQIRRKGQVHYEVPTTSVKDYDSSYEKVNWCCFRLYKSKYSNRTCMGKGLAVL